MVFYEWLHKASFQAQLKKHTLQEYLDIQAGLCGMNSSTWLIIDSLSKHISKWKNIIMKFVFHHEFETGLIKREYSWEEQPFGEHASKRIIFKFVYIDDIF